MQFVNSDDMNKYSLQEYEVQLVKLQKKKKKGLTLKSF